MSETLGWELNLMVVAFVRMRDCDPNPVQTNKKTNNVTRNTGLMITNPLALFSDDF